MAIRLGNIPSKDFQSARVALGINFPFNNKTVFSSTYQTVDSYRSNLLLFLTTGQGERYFKDPFYGNPLSRSLSSFSTEEELQEAIERLKESLGYFFPDLEILELQAEGARDNSISVTLRFKIKGTQQESEVVVRYI